MAQKKNLQETLLQHIHGGIITLAVAAGQKLGLFQSLCEADIHLTDVQICEQTDTKLRYVQEWLGCMTAAEIVSVDDDNKYFLSEEAKRAVKGMGYFSELLLPLSANASDVIDCFRKKGPNGFSYDKSMGFFDFLNADGQNLTPGMIQKVLLSKIANIKDVKAIKRVLDIGCGTGCLINVLAESLPHAEFVGIDPSEYAVSVAKKQTKEKSLSNVSFVHCAATDCPVTWEKSFDWILLWDVLHDLPNPKEVIEAAGRVLKHDGLLTIQDPAVHSMHRNNVGDMQAAVLMAIGMFWCLPNALKEGPGGAQLGVGWGMENKLKFMEELGWQEQKEARSELYTNMFTFSRTQTE